jgi:NAD(P)H-dependent flavin oxidoreductase YrpB (nitropropane dioxygenase family)
VFNPSAAKPGLSNRLWELEQPAAAAANQYFIAANNRIGREYEEFGDEAVEFYGSSYFAGTSSATWRRPTPKRSSSATKTWTRSPASATTGSSTVAAALRSTPGRCSHDQVQWPMLLKSNHRLVSGDLTMLLVTPLCERLGIDVPVVQAPVGSAVTPELAAAVSAAGGLGMLALTWTSPQKAVQQIRQVRYLTDRPFGVNLVLDFPVDPVLAACLGEGVPIISTFWGDPAAACKTIHAAGALHLHTVGSVEEAGQAVRAGADVLVAQGWEAGGHIRGQVATMALVPAVVDAVGEIPVIAAGGIGDGRGLAAVLALGAQAGWLGTRFLTATEAATHLVYRQALLDAAGDDAVHTRCFDGGWPNAAHRAVRNSTLAEWEAAGCPAGSDRPGEGDIVATDAKGRPHRRYSHMIPVPGMTGDPAELAMYAGQSVGLVNDQAPAAQIVAEIMSDAERALTALTGKQ